MALQSAVCFIFQFFVLNKTNNFIRFGKTLELFLYYFVIEKWPEMGTYAPTACFIQKPCVTHVSPEATLQSQEQFVLVRQAQKKKMRRQPKRNM